MDRSTFLRSSPREIDAFLNEIAKRDRQALRPAALICATLCNLKRDPSKKPDPWTVADFLQEGGESEELTDEEFAEKVLRGETFEVDPEKAKLFRKQIEAAFSNIKSQVTEVGPRGREKVERQ